MHSSLNVFNGRLIYFTYPGNSAGISSLLRKDGEERKRMRQPAQSADGRGVARPAA